MNFYTLTFKQKIFISFILLFLSIVLLDILLYFYVDLKTSKTFYINDKSSKVKHFKLNNHIKKDIVFLGSSRTFFHISTNTFKERNIDIYNLGINGAFLEDYPTLVQRVITSEIKPKSVVISLPVNKFYNRLGISKYPTLEEIKTFYAIDKLNFIRSIYRWSVNRHTFLRYSETIFYRALNMYEKFQPKINSEFPQYAIKTDVNYTKVTECDIFDIKKSTSNRMTLKCTNGDGIRTGNNITDQNRQNIKLTTLNYNTIKYLNTMVNNLNSRGIDVIIILEPIFHNYFMYNLNDIKNSFENATVIDATSFKVDDKMWADNGHFNYLGRKKYSLFLRELLK